MKFFITNVSGACTWSNHQVTCRFVGLSNFIFVCHTFWMSLIIWWHLITLFAANSTLWATQCTLTKWATSFVSNAATPFLEPKFTEAPLEPNPTRFLIFLIIYARNGDAIWNESTKAMDVYICNWLWEDWDG